MQIFNVSDHAHSLRSAFSYIDGRDPDWNDVENGGSRGSGFRIRQVILILKEGMGNRNPGLSATIEENRTVWMTSSRWTMCGHMM